MPAAPVFRVFVSSPSDVGREREMARKVCERVEGRLGGRLRIEPYFWEEKPMLANRGDFQEQIIEPAEFDLFICILWSRLGSRLHPGKHRRADGSEYASGTEYEFESAARSAQATGRPDLLVYRRSETPYLALEPKAEAAARLAQWEALQEFCRRWFADEETGAFKAAFNRYADLAAFEEKLEAHLLELARGRLGAAGADSPGQAPTWVQGSPYRGLQVFEMAHEPVFFGRTKARDEVLDALRTRWVSERCPFVLIFGASGSGKSSLLRAGILPWLTKPGVVEGVDRWRWLLWRPSDTPSGGDLLDGLATALLAPGALPELGIDGTSARTLAAMLRQNPAGAGLLLKGALSQAAAEAQRREDLPRQPLTCLAVGLDQLEETFTAAERFSPEGCTRFFRVVAALAHSGLAWIVGTLRSDFYARCEEHPELVALKQDKGQYHLLAPSAAELSQMIRLPAEAAGVLFEEHPEKGRLEDTLRDEALAEPGALPLLEYALDELYRAGAEKGLLTHADHEKLGGVEGALARRAEEVFATLSAGAQASLDGVLRQLVRISEGGEEAVARRTPSHAALTGAPGPRELVEAFLDARLLVGDQDAGGERIVTMAHESLLRSWPRAVAWTKANRDFLRVHARLGAALARWQAEHQGSDFLLPMGRPLAEAEDLLAGHADILNQAERQFIVASVEKREAAAREREKILAERERSLAETRRLLAEAARNDVLEASGCFARGEQARAFAHLARSLRYDPTGPAAPSAVILLHDARLQPPATLFLGHESEVRGIAFSPDGTRVLTASFDKTARLWDARSGQPVGEPLRHEGAVVSATFSPDGARALTASEDNTARLWDAPSGRPVGEPLRHEGAVRSATFSPDGLRVLTASEDKTARLWDAPSGRPVGEPLRHEGAVRSATFSPDGTRVLTASSDKTARLWDARSGQPRSGPMRHTGAVVSAVFSPDGLRVATASSDKTARLWDARSGQPLGGPLRHEDYVTSAAFSPDGTRVLTASSDKTARVWDARSGQPVGEPLRHRGSVNSAAFSPDGTRVLTAGNDLAARLWDARSGRPLGEPLCHEGAVAHAAFAPDGTRVVTASWDKTARLWDAQGEQSLGGPLRHEATVWSVLVSPDGTRVLTASEDNTVRLWDAQSGQPLGEPMRHPGGVKSAAFSPDGTRVLAAGLDKIACLWDARSGQPLGAPMRHQGSVNSAVFSPDGLRVLTASSDKTARLWDARSGQPLGEPLPHEDHVNRAIFSPDGTRLLTVSEDGTARAWDARSGQPLGEPLRYEGEALSAIFSPDGPRVLTVNGDRIARLWDAQSDHFLRHEGAVESAAFSPDGTRVLTTSLDKTARLWDARSGQPLGQPLLHEDHVNSITFSSDGLRVVTASGEAARLWDAQSGKSLGEPLRHAGEVVGATFAPSGLQVVTASCDRTARIWMVPPPDAGPVPAWFSTFLRWRAQARLDESGIFRHESGAEQVSTRKELVDALAIIPAGDKSFYGQFARRFMPEDAPASAEAKAAFDQPTGG